MEANTPANKTFDMNIVLRSNSNIVKKRQRPKTAYNNNNPKKKKQTNGEFVHLNQSYIHKNRLNKVPSREKSPIKVMIKSTSSGKSQFKPILAQRSMLSSLTRK